MTTSAQVLVVDDESLIRQSLRTALQQEGFSADMAASAKEAWERFRRDRPDIVLLDLMLGDADGFELLKGMKQEAPETKIIIVTAHGSIQRAVAAIKHGAYDFIKKPFDLAEIAATVSNAAEEKTLRPWRSTSCWNPAASSTGDGALWPPKRSDYSNAGDGLVTCAS